MATSKKPKMRFPVISTIVALNLASYVVMSAIRSDGAREPYIMKFGLCEVHGLLEVFLIACAVACWVDYFHDYVKYQIDLRFPDKQGGA